MPRKPAVKIASNAQKGPVLCQKQSAGPFVSFLETVPPVRGPELEQKSPGIVFSDAGALQNRISCWSCFSG